MIKRHVHVWYSRQDLNQTHSVNEFATFFSSRICFTSFSCRYRWVLSPLMLLSLLGARSTSLGMSVSLPPKLRANSPAFLYKWSRIWLWVFMSLSPNWNCWSKSYINICMYVYIYTYICLFIYLYINVSGYNTALPIMNHFDVASTKEFTTHHNSPIFRRLLFCRTPIRWSMDAGAAGTCGTSLVEAGAPRAMRSESIFLAPKILRRGTPNHRKTIGKPYEKPKMDGLSGRICRIPRDLWSLLIKSAVCCWEIGKKPSIKSRNIVQVHVWLFKAPTRFA